MHTWGYSFLAHWQGREKNYGQLFCKLPYQIILKKKKTATGNWLFAPRAFPSSLMLQLSFYRYLERRNIKHPTGSIQSSVVLSVDYKSHQPQRAWPTARADGELQSMNIWKTPSWAPLLFSRCAQTLQRIPQTRHDSRIFPSLFLPAPVANKHQ